MRMTTSVHSCVQNSISLRLNKFNLYNSGVFVVNGRLRVTTKEWMENRDTNVVDIIRKDEKTKMRQPGIEPGPLPWKGRILTIRPLTL